MVCNHELAGEQPITVVVFGSGPRLTQEVRRFLARLEEHPQITLLGVFCQGTSHSVRAVMGDLWRRRGVLALPLLLAWFGNTAVRLVRQPSAERRLRRVMGQISDRLHRVGDIHHETVLARVAEMAPDLGLVYGSPILKPALFEIPRLGTLGIHHGKVPQYRGNKTMFWAMYNGERTAGVTIQKINAGLDTGHIVKEGEVLIGNRAPGSVRSELEALGLDLYIEAILEVKENRASFRAQSGPSGQLYRNPTTRDLVLFWVRHLRRRLHGS